MARMVATKAALSIRVDALSDAESRSDPAAAEIGISNRVKLESRLRALEHRAGIQSVRKVTTGVNGRSQPKFEMTGAAAAGSYNPAADSVQMLPTQPIVVAKAQEERAEKESKKDKKKRKSEVGDVSIDADGDESMRVGETKEERKARKEAKKAVSRVEQSNGIGISTKADGTQAKAAKKAAEEGVSTPAKEEKKSKKRRAEDVDGAAADGTPVADGEKKKKKKKRDSEAA
jgi:nucleolar protein 58